MWKNLKECLSLKSDEDVETKLKQIANALVFSFLTKSHCSDLN
jgi:hypothetical protein